MKTIKFYIGSDLKFALLSQRYWADYTSVVNHQVLVKIKSNNNFCVITEINKTGNKDKPVEIPMQTDQPSNLSVNLGGVSIYQTCIDGLLPQQLLNDNIVTILLK